ncbi:MAG: GNAT family N-acetyltransferase [Bdellovibrionales bacterium]|nr:GNAT family N-acetyltransferase [Bdellovibrionales bacterium]
MTGKGGDPIDAVRWPLFADFWIAPYQALGSAWVASEGERVLGYLTGVVDTHEFRRHKLWRVDLPFVSRIVRGHYGWRPDVKTALLRTLRYRRLPEDSFGAERLAEWRTEYAAHLHINFRSDVRGRGLGRQLIEAFVADLRQQRVNGVHLFCGDSATAFYRKAGFAELARHEVAPGAHVFAFGRRLL